MEGKQPRCRRRQLLQCAGDEIAVVLLPVNFPQAPLVQLSLPLSDGGQQQPAWAQHLRHLSEGKGQVFRLDVDQPRRQQNPVHRTDAGVVFQHVPLIKRDVRVALPGDVQALAAEIQPYGVKALGPDAARLIPRCRSTGSAPALRKAAGREIRPDMPPRCSRFPPTPLRSCRSTPVRCAFYLSPLRAAPQPPALPANTFHSPAWAPLPRFWGPRRPRPGCPQHKGTGTQVRGGTAPPP